MFWVVHYSRLLSCCSSRASVSVRFPSFFSLPTLCPAPIMSFDWGLLLSVLYPGAVGVFDFLRPRPLGLVPFTVLSMGSSRGLDFDGFIFFQRRCDFGFVFWGQRLWPCAALSFPSPGGQRIGALFLSSPVWFSTKKAPARESGSWPFFQGPSTFLPFSPLHLFFLKSSFSLPQKLFLFSVSGLSCNFFFCHFFLLLKPLIYCFYRVTPV